MQIQEQFMKQKRQVSNKKIIYKFEDKNLLNFFLEIETFNLDVLHLVWGGTI